MNHQKVAHYFPWLFPSIRSCVCNDADQRGVRVTAPFDLVAAIDAEIANLCDPRCSQHHDDHNTSVPMLQYSSSDTERGIFDGGDGRPSSLLPGPLTYLQDLPPHRIAPLKEGAPRCLLLTLRPRNRSMRSFADRSLFWVLLSSFQTCT